MSGSLRPRLVRGVVSVVVCTALGLSGGGGSVAAGRTPQAGDDDGVAAAVAAVDAAASTGDVRADVLAATTAGPGAPAPDPATIDEYPRYVGQTTCDPTPKPGAVYLLNLVLAYYRIGQSSGISRACSVGGTSEHKEGRAFDWAVSVAKPAEKAAGDAFVAWLTATGPDGKVGWNARRLGVMYVIWNKQIWSDTSSTASWQPYSGSSDHTDHVHVSMSWAGAYAQTSWWTGVAMPTRAATQVYVRAVYQSLFERAPDATGLAGWTGALVDYATPRAAVANGITASAEYRSSLITDAYATYLGRAPDATGLAAWLAVMGTGTSIEQMESGFLASDEQYALAGATDDGWVSALYRAVLDRPAAPSEVAAWTAVLRQGGARRQVALGFLFSTEHVTAVVRGYFEDLLGRDVDGVGATGWVTQIQSGTREEAVVAGIVASEEYWNLVHRS